jgi:hypothetical protein
MVRKKSFQTIVQDFLEIKGLPIIYSQDLLKLAILVFPRDLKEMATK